MDGIRVSLRPSGNDKLTGGRKDLNFYATYREVGTTCPSTCPLLNAGCYAQGGNVPIHARGRVSESDGVVYLRELSRIPHGAIMRLHVSGDVLLHDALDVDYLNAIIHGATLRPDMTFYSYTHAWRMIDRAEFVFPKNLVINASCDNEEEVAEARAAGWDTVTVVPESVEGKRYGNMVVCPQQTVGMSCAECKLCMKASRRLTVAFKAHGFNKKNVSKRLAN
jgi:hypothetical protein